MKRLKTVVLSVALTGVISGRCYHASAQEALPTTLAMKAATATIAGKPEVRLRWSVKEGRIPEGSFNIYRTEVADRGGVRREAATKVKINSSAVILNPAAANAVKLTPGFKFTDLLTRSRQVVPGLSEKQLFSAETPGPRPPSSAPVFQAIKSATLAARGLRGPAFSSRAVDREIESIPVVRDYLTKVRGAAPGMPVRDLQPHIHGAVTRGINPQADSVREARTRLVLGSLVNPTLGRAMGMAFEDKNVVAGVTYQYALGYTAPGKPEVEMATTTITVGADSQPEAPTGLLARQVNESIVALRWERLTAEQESNLGIAGYYVTRTDPQNPNGIKLNTAPVLSAGMLDRTSPIKKLVDPADTFVDDKAVEGNLTYSVMIVDMFGRESPASTVTINFEDWRTPPPPFLVTAVLMGDRAQVNIRCHLSTLPIQVKVYRADNENPGDPPVLLTQTPLSTGRPPFGGGQILISGYYDVNPPRDRYHRYLVTAQYAKNQRESAPAMSDPMAAPLLTAPPAPSNVRAQAFIRAGARGIDPKLMFTTSVSKLDIKLNQSIIAAFKTTARDVGGSQTLVWDKPAAGGQPYTYRVFRAVATGFVPTPTGAERSIGIEHMTVQQRGLFDQYVGGFSSTVAKNQSAITAALATATPAPAKKYSDIIISTVAEKIKYYDLIVNVQKWTLAAELKNIERFTEQVDKAQAHYVKYRVIPVNRWGVEGPTAELTVRIPATLPPSVPVLNLVHPNQAERSHIDVDLQANIVQEDVTAYRVYRKAMPPRNQILEVLKRNRITLEQKYNRPDPIGPVVTPVPEIKANPAVTDLILKSSVISQVADKIQFVRPKTNIWTKLREVPESRGVGDQVAMKLVDTGRVYSLLGLYDLTGYTEVGRLNVPDPSKVSKVTFTDKTAEPEVEYAYRVVALNRDGISSFASVVLDAAGHKTTTTPPASVAVESIAGGVNINWTAAPQAVGYFVQRGADPGGKFIQITGLLPGMLKFTDFSALPGRTYQYQVLAVDKYGNLSAPKPAGNNPFKVAVVP